MNKNGNIMERKAEMYEMIMAIENDFIFNFVEKLKITNISSKLIEKAVKSNNENKCIAILEGLDIQSYIEICNENIDNLHINKEMKKFLNKELIEIIPIRNKVMHPRPLAIFDYHKVKAIFDEIEEIMNNFEWKNISKTKTKIRDTPQELMFPPQNAIKSENIIENIPTAVDFEDTSFIGRRKEIGELKSKLNKRNVHILSIIGDGGIGKTAIAIKLLYDLIDDETCNFNLILWATLKTNELNNYEFKEIKNSISDTSHMYEKLGEFVGNNKNENTKNYLIDLAKEFKMLLVIDNLETINTGDIKEFLDDFSEYGKVLITSRIGLGEMEHRYRLEGLCEEDALQYMCTLLELYGFEGNFSEKEIINFSSKQLYSNPLAIKWFVRCLYNGQTVENILDNREDLAIFCMSNVYEKLSPKSQSILDVLMIANYELSFAELMFYMDVNINNYIDDYKDISDAVNDLIKSNFVDYTIFRSQKKLSITIFAREFLKCCYVEKKELLNSYNTKLKKLRSFEQKQLQRKSKSPYSMKEFSIKPGEMSKLVAAYYLDLAMKESKNDSLELALKYVEYAKKLEINYFQCNKIAAFLYGTNRQNKAKEEFEIALKCSDNNNDKITIYIVYAGYLLRCNDYLGALNLLEKAEKLNDNEINIYLIFEKVKIFGCLYKFKEAYNELSKIDSQSIDTKNKNIYLTRNADLKRREAEQYDHRNLDKKLDLLHSSYDLLKSSKNPDDGIYQYMLKLIESLAYLYYEPKANEMILEIFDNYYSYIKKNREFKKIQRIIKSKLEFMENKKIADKLLKYTVDVKDKTKSLNENEGIVYHLRKGEKFGFFRTENNDSGVYFKITSNIENINIGDIVRYDALTKTPRGIMTNKINSFYTPK